MSGLVTEMTHVREDHRHAMFVGGVDDFLIAHGATGLDHTGDSGSRSGINAIAEREECIGCHDGSLDFQTLVLGFDAGDFGGVDAAHLASTDTDGHFVFRVDNGIGLDELADFPAEQQVIEFLGGWLPFGDNLQLFAGDDATVAFLNQQATIHAFQIVTRGGFLMPFATFQQADIGFFRNGCFGFGGYGRGDNDFDKLAADNRFGGRAVQFTVRRSDRF